MIDYTEQFVTFQAEKVGETMAFYSLSNSTDSKDLTYMIKETFLYGLITELKLKFEGYMNKDDRDFIQSYPLISDHMNRLNMYLASIRVEVPQLQELDKNLIGKWLRIS